MANSATKRRRKLSTSIARLEREWQRLCAAKLPLENADSIWRFSRRTTAKDPEQGWKLHVSATILTANQIFKRIAPVLLRCGVLFKAPSSLQELQKLNCGIYYGFSQVGKFITVYPRTSEEATSLSQLLDRRLRRLGGPAVPYDVRYKKGSNIFYRYGAFGNLQIVQPGGTRQSAVRMPNGKLVVDRRAPGAAVPAWTENPFSKAALSTNGKKPNNTPLNTVVRVYEAISQRGKGGVYQAVDTTVTPMRLCILKEGRRHGETDWDGRDGYWRARHEEKVLLSLRLAGVRVPEVYRSFKSGPNYYVAMELIDGINLYTLLTARTVPLRSAVRYGIQIAQLLESIHAAGWVWRDCKPLNLVVTKRGSLRPVDFEGACLAFRNEPTPWGTANYASKEINDASIVSRVPQDLYALGAILYHLFTGRPSLTDDPLKGLDDTNHRTPESVRKLIANLMNENAAQRPTARSARRTLEKNKRN